MTIKSTFIFLGMIFFGLLLVGCKEEIETTTPTLEVPNLALEVKISETKKISYNVENEKQDTKVIFFSGNDEIATVDEEGNVTGVSSGQVTVLVYLEGNDAVFDVIVTVLDDIEQNKLENITSWVKQTVSSETNINMNLPLTDQMYGSSISWTSDNVAVIDNEGRVYQKEFDQSANLTFTITHEQQTITDSILVVVLGYAYELVADDFLKQFSNLITRDYLTLKTTNTNYPNAMITWSSSNQDVFSNAGKYYKPEVNTSFIITVEVAFQDQTNIHYFHKEVVAQGITIYEKTDEIEEDILALLNLGKMIDDSIELPTYHEKHQANLRWVSNNTSVITSTGTYVPPIQNQMITLRCEVTIGSAYDSFTIELEAAGKDYSATWEAVDDFLALIFLDEIKTQRYTMYGGTSYTAYNYGYVPFYSEAKSVILDGMVPFADRPGTIKTETRWVVIHDTANTNIGSDAEMHTRYIRGNPGVSWHYSIDDEETYQHVPDEEVAYHAGASEGNYYGIGIETCVNNGVDYNVVMRRTAKLTAELLLEFDLSLYHVRQHNYYSGKDCPHVMRAANRWNEFLNLVAIEYFAITKLQGVSFVWESLSPEVLDHTGKIISTAGTQTDVSYRVSVTFGGETKEFTHTSTLLAKSW
jgi:hypothetical protein